ncbi:DUF896 domain-containing protein [Bacillus sp. T3]|uniref:DUF896 domain-containing protein n=1 Tax=Bacillus sp. T3 TaxID=467262 RepID=UPI002980BCC5|nr:DUF896 domain-containing protein [Bacillus sp. T3]
MIDFLERINELSRKQNEDGLTNAEKVEQQVLREDYLRAIRGQVLHTFSGMKILDPLGNDVTPQKVRKLNTKDELKEWENKGERLFSKSHCSQ